MEIPELLYLHNSRKAESFGHYRPCFVVQMVSIRAVVLTGYQRQTDVAALLEEVRESERREAAGIYTLAKGAAYQ